MKPEDLNAGQKEIKLADEQLEAASGGTGESSPANEFYCPSCGSTDVSSEYLGEGFYECSCHKCGYKWEFPY